MCVTYIIHYIYNVCVCVYLTDTDNSVAIARRKGKEGWGADGHGQRGGMKTERDLACGDGRVMQCADDVLLSCTQNLCGFVSQYHPNKSNKT